MQVMIARIKYNSAFESFAVKSIILLTFGFSLLCSAKGQSSGKLLEYNTVIKVEKSSLIEERSYYIEVDNKESDWLSEIKIPYNKSSSIDILEAIVLNSNGEIVRKLSKKEIVTKSDISENSFYEDDLAKEFSLRNDEYPYYIKYTYRKSTEKFINVAFWTPLRFTTLGTYKASLKVELPKGYKVRTWYSGNFDFTRDSSADKIILTWNSELVKSFKKEIMAPPDVDLIPRVIIVPESFTFGIPGKLDSWKSFGIWLEETNNGLDALPLSEQIKVTSLLVGVNDRVEKMKRLYHYMQDNTHYINVSVDLGSLKSYPASYVCNNKYGDCKALTIYMKGLLKFAGIESYYTIVRLGLNESKILTDFPFEQFNHVVLSVPNGNDTIWLENTSQVNPFNYMGQFTGDRYALVVNGPQSRLVKTPSIKKEDLTVVSMYRIIPEISGKISVHLEKNLRGYEFEKWLGISGEAPEADIKEDVGELLDLKNEVIKYEFQHPGRDESSMKLIADFEADNGLRNIGGNLVFIPFPIKIYPFEKPENRKNPVKIYLPVDQIDSMILEIPFRGDYVVELPADVNISSKYGSLTVNFKKETQKVKIIRHFTLPSSEYTLDEYSAFYAFIEAVTRSMKKSAIILNKKV